MTKNIQSDLIIIEKMAQSRILVVGDIMLDRYVYGHVERISPESPVPILSIAREIRMLGGAGNTLSNLAHLKCEADIVSLVGQDEDGMEIQTLIADLGLAVDGIIAKADRPTIVKTRFLAGHQQLLRADYEKIFPFTPETEDQILKNIQAHMDSCTLVILSDYGKGLLTPQIVRGIMEMARKNKIPVIVDPKAKDYSLYKGAFAVTPNKKELSEATGGMPVETDEDITLAARKLIEISGITHVVATRSKDGISVIDAKSCTHIRSAAKIEVFDVSGAGDTVIATLGASVAAGADIKQAASLANIAGSIVVTKVGTAPIRAEELIKAMSHPSIDTKENSDLSAYDWLSAKEEILRWKARGLKVGLTNGCFDILHKGHVSYLNDARARCDKLVVGLNRDASVKILKGPERPIHDEDARAAVLSALGCVDMVVLFGAEQKGQDNTACDLIAQIHPDIYFKGGDYTIDQIPEAPAIRAVGGTVEIMPNYEGHSTTASVTKITDSRVA